MTDLPFLDAIFDSHVTFIPDDVATLMPLITSTELRRLAIERILGEHAADAPEQRRSNTHGDAVPHYRHAVTTDGEWAREEGREGRILLREVTEEVDLKIRNAQTIGRLSGYAHNPDREWFRISANYWIINGGGSEPDRVVMGYGNGFIRSMENALILFSAAKVGEWIRDNLHPRAASLTAIVSKASAQTACIAWLKKEFGHPDTASHTKPSFWKMAQEKWPGELARRGFLVAWDTATLDCPERRVAGRKKKAAC